MPRTRRKSSGQRSIPAERKPAKPTARYGKTILNHGLVFLLGGALVAAVFIASPDLITGKAEPVAIRTGDSNDATASPIPAGDNAESAPIPTGNDAEPDTLAELLALDPDQLAQADIARVNLLCAEGLPGAERLDVEKALTRLDEWAGRVRFWTDQSMWDFRRNPDKFENSLAKFRVLLLISVLQQDFGVHYNDRGERNCDFSNSRNAFLHGMIDDTNGGTCASMPVMYVAVGRLCSSWVWGGAKAWTEEVTRKATKKTLGVVYPKNTNTAICSCVNPNEPTAWKVPPIIKLGLPKPPPRLGKRPW